MARQWRNSKTFVRKGGSGDPGKRTMRVLRFLPDKHGKIHEYKFAVIAETPLGEGAGR